MDLVWFGGLLLSSVVSLCFLERKAWKSRVLHEKRADEAWPLLRDTEMFSPSIPVFSADGKAGVSACGHPSWMGFAGCSSVAFGFQHLQYSVIRPSPIQQMGDQIQSQRLHWILPLSEEQCARNIALILSRKLEKSWSSQVEVGRIPLPELAAGC